MPTPPTPLKMSQFMIASPDTGSYFVAVESGSVDTNVLINSTLIPALSWVSPPSHYNSAGTVGNFSSDGTYMYFYYAGIWNRVALVPGLF